jgi:hypothetical protein
MREIRTSGSMSGDGKRSVAAWPKLPRPSSTLPKRARAYATDVRSWWKLTYERSGGIRFLTPSSHAPFRLFAAQTKPLPPFR